MTDNWTPRETFLFFVFFLFCLWLAGVGAENL